MSGERSEEWFKAVDELILSARSLAHATAVAIQGGAISGTDRVCQMASLARSTDTIISNIDLAASRARNGKPITRLQAKTILKVEEAITRRDIAEQMRAGERIAGRPEADPFDGQ